VLQVLYGKTLYKGKSPDGYTRYWIESDESVQMFNGNWYKLQDVMKFMTEEPVGLQRPVFNIGLLDGHITP